MRKTALSISTISGFLLLFGVARAIQTAPPPNPVGPDPAISTRVLASYGRLPLAFEENRGQTDPRVRFLVRGEGFGLFLTSGEVVLRLAPGDVREAGREAPPEPAKARALRIEIAGGRPGARVVGEGELPLTTNYLRLDGRGAPRTGIPSFARVRYQDIYPGVDLLFYGRDRRLEHDFVLAPGADPRLLRLAITGADRLEIDPAGSLVLHVGDGAVRLEKPVAYQEVAGRRREVASRYRLLRGGREVGFALGPYDRREPLVVDPVLVYSTYLGGSHDYLRPAANRGNAVAVDRFGRAYVTGYTDALDFPTTAGGPGVPGPGAQQHPPVDWNFRGDAYVTILRADGSPFVSTYLATTDSDSGNAIAVSDQGIYVAGTTSSDEGFFSWVTRLDMYATEILATRSAARGRSRGLGIAVDPAGDVYVTGDSRNGPEDEGHWDYAFVAKLSPDLLQLGYSVVLDGSSHDEGDAIAVDPAGNAYVVGVSSSPDFPLVPSGPAGGGAGFLSKLGPDGAILYSVRASAAEHVAVDAQGDAYVVGSTAEAGLATPDGLQTAPRGDSDLLLTRYDTTGKIAYATYLGGSGTDESGGIAVDRFGNVYLAGTTSSTDFPLKNALPTACSSPSACLPDTFVAKLFRQGSALGYSTLLGGSGYDFARGIAVDPEGVAVVTGETRSHDFPLVHPAQPDFRGGLDAFVAKIASPNLPPLCTGASATPATLWPPNHQLVPVGIQGVTDPEGDPVTIQITGIAQDEPLSGNTPDASGIGSATAQVRAERAGGGDGRVYHLTFTATDPQGASCTGAVTICVPHDQGHGQACGDGGALYGSTGR